MTAELGTRRTSGVARVGWDLWELVSVPVRRIPSRIRDRRFLQVQALVLVATASHYTVETPGLADATGAPPPPFRLRFLDYRPDAAVNGGA